MIEFRLSRADLPYLLVIVLAVVVWFFPFFGRGEMLIPVNATSAYPWYGTSAYSEPHPQGSMDTVRENYISWALQDRYLDEGFAPHWNPTIFNGNPMLANQFAIPYSPYKLLNIPFDAPLGWSWAVVLKSLINGLFTYAVARTLARSRAASTVAALAWMLSWPLAHQTQTTYNEGVAWLPPLFFFALHSWRVAGWPRRIFYGLLVGLIAGFQFLAGNLQMTIYSFLFILACGAYFAWEQRRWWPLISPFAAYTVGAGVGAVQILSSYELFTHSIRGVSQTHQNKGIEPYTSISFLNPWVYFWRNFEFPALRAKYWLDYRWNPFIGLLPLFGAFMALYIKDRFGRFLLLLVVGVYGVQHVLYLRPIFELVSGVPGYNIMDQVRLLIMLPFPLALLAAYGLDWLLEHGPTQRRKAGLAIGIALLVGVVMAFGIASLETFWRGELASYRMPDDSFESQRTYTGLRILADYYRLKNPLFAASFVFWAGALAILIMGTARRWRIVAPLMIGLVLVEMVYFARVNVATAPREALYPTTPAIVWLQDRMAEDGPFRISGAPNTLNQGRGYSPYLNYSDDHGWFMSSALPPLVPNTAGLYGLQDIRGYESVYTLRYSEYMARVDGLAQPFGAGLWLSYTITHPMLDALNMRYIMAIEPLALEGLRLVYEGEVYIYENPNSLPRAMLYDNFTVLADDAAVLEVLSAPDFDPWTDLYLAESPDFTLPDDADAQAGDAAIVEYTPNRVVIETDNVAEAVLVLADLDYPGWIARVDGAETPIFNANYLMRGIRLPAGAHHVEFVYQSPIIIWGERLSLACFGLVILGVIIIRWRSR